MTTFARSLRSGLLSLAATAALGWGGAGCSSTASTSDAGAQEAGSSDAGQGSDALNDSGNSPSPDGGATDSAIDAPPPVCLPAGTITVTNPDESSYEFSSVGGVNPRLTLCRGRTYTFAVNAPLHPFWLKPSQASGTADPLASGVTGNGTDSGNVVFTVPAAAPATLYYICEVHDEMTGVISIID